MRGNAAAWRVAGWSAGVLLLLAGLPLVASGRLPGRLATHWSGDGAPDGSMPLWAAALFPALIWLVLVAAVAAGYWRASGRTGGGAQGWAKATLLAGGVFLVGGQAAVVWANVDRGHWREAGPVSGRLVVALVMAVSAGSALWIATRRGTATRGSAPSGPGMEIPGGQRLVWLSRASNRWIQVLSAFSGLVAVVPVVAAVAGLTGLHWSLIAPFALVSLVALGCASVQARISEKGLEVSFGPFGWPTRRWATRDIESARAERRTPAQVGGWGYRLSGLGTTVMLRGGECLVVRARGKDFAVSVDDAERGAALLNSLTAVRSA
ncbi:DUF1648 domain-containing protein [Streptomyces alboniger]|uniref:DUF1648 domain-containing protein n=1 Tax=Streptomyces alboniger TaxID=132473 RepID=A0A5J6HS45_STRAD|nr:DUF1648 domain-containing protein [Streptomyces alboniger]QEV22498.1 DUF1648 domain-containing protein [Streptomyces alboniger]